MVLYFIYNIKNEFSLSKPAYFYEKEQFIDYYRQRKNSQLRELPFTKSNLFLAGFFKFLVELVDTAIGRNCSLFASVEWVAVRASFNFDFFAHG